MYTHIVSMVAEECSVILVCVNDSPRRTGEDVKNSGCDLLCSDASWDTTQRFTLWHGYSFTRTHTYTQI